MILIVSSLFVSAQTADLTIKITDLEVIDPSKVMMALYNSEETYFDSEQVFRTAAVSVDSSTAIMVIPELPYGVYAFTVFHDEDNDDEMDRRWYGPPKEGYAFSNNFTSSIRPAKWDDASFEFDGEKTVEIKMIY